MTVKQGAASLTLGAIGFSLLLGLSASAAWGQAAKDLKCKKCVGSGDMGKNAVSAKSMKNNAVTTPKIKNGAVTNGKIGNNAVTGAKIQNGTVGLQDLAPDVLDSLPGTADVAVTVDCGAGDTIQAEVDAAQPGVTTTITLANDCTENVIVAKDDIVISGDPANGGAQGGTSTLTGGITITGADRVVIDNLTVSDNTAGSFPVGITVTAGSSASITDSVVSGHVAAGAMAGDSAGAGIFVTRNAFVAMDNISVTNPVGGEEALILTDGAGVRASNSDFTSEDGSQFVGAAIGLYRSANMRLNGNSTVTNTVDSTDPTAALAINVADTSNFRMQSGTNVVDGNVSIESNSGADFRGVTFTGEFEVGGNSAVTFNNSAAVTGNIDIIGGSQVQAWSLTVTGAITCSSLSGLEAGTLTATGGTGTCNLAP